MTSTDETYATPADVASAWPAFAKLPDVEQSALIAAACASIRAFCRRSFTQQTYVETHSGRNRSRLWLNVRPVVQVAAAVVNGEALDNSRGDAWTFKPASGELVRGDGLCDPRFAAWFPTGTGNVVVTYSGGYDPIPDDVKRAAILTVQTIQAAGKLSGAYKSESIGDYSYTLNDALRNPIPPTAAFLLSRYIQDEFL